MPRGKTWFTLEEAVRTFALKRAERLKWVEEDIVRADNADDGR